jgi:hypothetical protein
MAGGDVLVAVSASGNAANVLRAVHLAKERRATTIGWTGLEGRKLKSLVGQCVVVPSDCMQADRGRSPRRSPRGLRLPARATVGTRQRSHPPPFTKRLHQPYVPAY